MAWRAHLKGDPFPWLLEPSDPAVRAQTLRILLGRKAGDQEVREAQRRAMDTPPISTILRRQKTDGGWPGTPLYSPKYRSSHWANLLLLEYGADPADPRVRRAARYVLKQLSAPRHGGMGWVIDRDHGAACFTGSVVRYLVDAGFAADARLEPLVARLVRDAELDAGCWINGELPCGWGGARLVWGLAALPSSLRTREVEQALSRGVEFLLSYRLRKGMFPTASAPSYLWRQVSFPLFYQADVLFVLRALDAAGAIGDDRARPAIEWLLSRQDSHGRWAARSPYASRTPSHVDASKWATLHACTVLKHAFGENGA